VIPRDGIEWIVLAVAVYMILAAGVTAKARGALGSWDADRVRLATGVGRRLGVLVLAFYVGLRVFTVIR